MGNISNLYVKIKGKTEEETSQVLIELFKEEIKKVEGEFYCPLIKNNDNLIGFKGRTSNKHLYFNRLLDYSKERSDMKIKISITDEGDWHSSVKHYKLRKGNYMLFKIEENPYMIDINTYPQKIEELYEKGVRELMKFNSADLVNECLKYPPHPVSVEVENDKYKIHVKSNHGFYEITSLFEKEWKSSWKELTKENLSTNDDDWPF